MRQQPVRIAIDLETTGLRPDQDEIIEIGALKFAGDEILDTFESLVNAGKAIPFRVQRLTGITGVDIKSAPPLADVVNRLRDFLGDLPLVGHSVPFDAAFLRRAGLARRSPLLDTYELASALLPGLPSYTLGAVGSALGVSSPTFHRALADAQLSRDVFLALLVRLHELNTGTLEALARIGAPHEWTPAYLVRTALRERTAVASQSQVFGGFATSSLGDQLAARLGMDPAVLTLAITPDTLPLTTFDVQAQEHETSDADAALCESLARQVAASMASGGVAVLETQNVDAGLVASLGAAADWAVNTDQRLTIACADAERVGQVMREVLPDVAHGATQDASGLTVAQMYDESSYLCLHRWFGHARELARMKCSRDVARGLAKVSVWVASTTTGSRSELSLSTSETAAWEMARAGHEYAESCATCSYRRDGYCFVERARRAAGKARIVLTTHAVLANALRGKGKADVPLERVVVLDAHLLEAHLRESSLKAVDRPTLEAVLTALWNVDDTGLLRNASRRLDAGQARTREQQWGALVDRATRSTESFFARLEELFGEMRSTTDGDVQVEPGSIRITSQTRQLPAWSAMTHAWAELDDRLGNLAKTARNIGEQLLKQARRREPSADGLVTDLHGMANAIDQIRQYGAALTGRPQDNVVYWLQVPYAMSTQPVPTTSDENSQPANSDANGKGSTLNHDGGVVTEHVRICSAPIFVGDMLEPLKTADRSLILLAPALAVAGDFSYLLSALGLPASTSTFAPARDREKQTLLCLPEDLPEPNTPQHQRHLDELLIKLAIALDGNVVALFPSHTALRTSAVSLKRALQSRNILVLAQGQDGSARQLWHAFRTDTRVVLLGAGSFWDGLAPSDKPPACVVVTRLPFPALSDPVLASRAETHLDTQSQFVVPYAALKVRQALGGLAWSHPEKNVVVLCDRRVQTRGYGSTLLATLPHCATCQEPSAHMVERAAEWLGK